MRISAILLGFLLDALLGDPQAWWHPVCAIGSLIAKTERVLRRRMQNLRAAGAVLWCVVCAVSFFVPMALLYLARAVSPWLDFALETLFCYWIFARRCLADESRRVQAALEGGSIEDARHAVSYLVGRDTAALDAAGVTRAAVETVAENTSDGVVAPMLYLFLGGAPLGFLYKAVNTLDSMVGYKNEKYIDFGRFSAKMDDLFNYIPARLSALCMIAGAFALGLDGKNAYRVWRRDRRKHASPNSAQTESVCAGALGVQLAGDASYFGKIVAKPTIGDARRPIQPAFISRAIGLMTACALFTLALCTMIYLAGKGVGAWS